MRVLLVEDDEMLGSGIQVGMNQYGYSVDWIKDGISAVEIIKTSSFDAIVLDLGLPKLSGLKVLRQWRSEGLRTPVLILTARDSIDDRIVGLDTGADDYLVKPFDLDEMCARLRALTRRGVGGGGRDGGNFLSYKGISLDLKANIIIKNNISIAVPRREFKILQKLIENAGSVVSRESLNQSLYGWDEDIDSNTLEVHIHNLRKKLDGNFIRTIRGVGYMVDKEK